MRGYAVSGVFQVLVEHLPGIHAGFVTNVSLPWRDFNAWMGSIDWASRIAGYSGQSL